MMRQLTYSYLNPFMTTHTVSTQSQKYHMKTHTTLSMQSRQYHDTIPMISLESMHHYIENMERFYQAQFTLEEQQVIERINDTARKMGFLYLIDHTVDNGLLGAIREDARKFFLLPDEKKNEISIHQSKCRG